MTVRSYKTQYFDTEGRENLPLVLKSISTFIRGLKGQGLPVPGKLIFLTRQGQGPMLAYNQFHEEDIKIIAVTFPRHFGATREDGTFFAPEISDKVRNFFTGVGIPIVTNRLPFDDIQGFPSHNHDMGVLRDALAIFGGSVPLAIQAVLQATDAGYIEVGDRVITATGDTALLVTASTTQMFLRKDEFGLSVNEIICKPRVFTQSRRPHPQLTPPIEGGGQIEASSSGKD